MPIISRIGAAAARGFGLFGRIAAAVDEYFEYVTLLLPGNGTNGAQNNTFLDSSSNAFTITRNGNTTQGTFSPFSQTGWSNFFDGSGDYCTLSSNASMDFGTGNFTIECFVNTGVFSISGGASRSIIGNSGNSYTMQLYIDTTSGRVVFGNTVSTFLQGTNTVADNQWHHVVVVRSGTGSNQIALFVDGNRQAVGTNSQNYSSGTIYLGAFDTGNGFWNGYISNLRIVKGTAVYDPTLTTLTVPTTPLTAVSNTALLTFQSNRFIDNSSNAYTITRTGDVSVQAFSPFNPTAAWSAATYGGSGYFDGSGDYLSMTSGTSLGSGDFTIGCWIYLTASPGLETSVGSSYNYYTSGNNGNFVFRVGTTNLWRSFDGQGNQASVTGTYTWTLNTWVYMAWVRSGSTLTVYRDGTSIGSTTESKTLSNSANGYVLGADRINGSIGTYMTGYISGFRVLVGTADTTVPTAPPTAISNTQLLCNFTNAGIYDATAKNDLETVGNAQISTTQSKFGGSSMSFDGTGDFLSLAPTSPNLIFGTGDFTIEMWVYLNSPINVGYVINQDFNNAGGSFGNYLIYVNATNGATAFYSSTNGSSWNNISNLSIGTMSASAWNHVAVTRASGTTRTFLNGALISSIADTGNYANTGRMLVGTYNASLATFNGYINDLRITKGIARYTSNFTPPTTAFPLQ